MATKAEKLKELIELNGGSSDGHTIGEVLTDFVELMGGTTDDVSVNGIIDDMKSLKFGGGGSGGGIPDSDLFAYYDQPLTDAETNIRIMGVEVPVVIPAEITMNCEILNIENLDWDTENYPLGDQILAFKPTFYYDNDPFESYAPFTINIPEELVPCESMQAYMLYVWDDQYGGYMLGPFVYHGQRINLNEVYSGTIVVTNTFSEAAAVNWIRSFISSEATIYEKPFETANNALVSVSGEYAHISNYFKDANGITWYRIYNGDTFYSSGFYDEYVYVKSDDVRQS